MKTIFHIIFSILVANPNQTNQVERDTFELYLSEQEHNHWKKEITKDETFELISIDTIRID